MTAGLSAIALFTPIIASNAVFSMRRASRGLNAIEDNPLYGAMNMDIAAGQTLKGARAAKAIAVSSGTELGEVFEGATQAIKKASESSKVLRGAGKVLQFTADNINPIICATGAVKVAFADDKLDAAAREGIALGCMFGAERLAKKVLGMPIASKGGTKAGEALYKKNPFINEQVSALKDFCTTKKLFNNISLNAAPAIAKGLFFVGASIAGYKLGTVIADGILGKEKNAS